MLSSNFSIQQPIRACNPTSPAGSWHYPLQLYTTLRVVDTFSMLLKLMFYSEYLHHYHFSWRAHGLSLEFPSGDITTSFPIQQQELCNQPCTILCWFTIAKLTGKHAQLFFRHQSTSRLTFNFCQYHFSCHRGRLKLNHPLEFNLHLGTFH